MMIDGDALGEFAGERVEADRGAGSVRWACCHQRQQRGQRHRPDRVSA